MTSTVSSESRALAVRSILMMADGDRATFDQVVHPAAVNREDNVEPPAARTPGPEGFWATAAWLRSAFADLSYEVHEVVAEGNLVAIRTTMSGRHVAPFVVHAEDGSVDTVFPPTGRTFAITQSHWLRIEDGLVIEHWANRDDLGQAQQLAWVPPTPLYLFKMARAKSKARKAAA
ncbi:ester cyclase [Kribbella endophytica]